MSRKVKEFVDIKDYANLDALIENLTEIRSNLPPDAEPELKLKGDDVFGRSLCISYFRPQTHEEMECDARYAEAYRQSGVVGLRALRSGPCHLRSVA